MINVVKSSVSLLTTVGPLESSVLSNYHQHVIIVYEAPVYCLGGGTSDHCPVAAVALCNNMHLKWHAWLDLSFFEIVELKLELMLKLLNWIKEDKLNGQSPYLDLYNCKKAKKYPKW